MKTKRKAVLPGFGLTMGLTILYLGVLVLIPLSMVFLNSMSLGFSGFWETVTNARAIASYKLSFGTAFIAACINGVFGILIAWVLTRYQFPGKKIIDSLVDLPFALPTAVAGIALTTLYSTNGWIGQFFSFKIAFTPIGIMVALVFIGLPFVVRMVQPVLANIEKELEEVSSILGASRWQTFCKVIFPELIPAVLTGFALSFARSLGEYGSVVFISGNTPYKTEITPLIIMTKLEQYDYVGATAIAAVMLVFTFIILLFINVLQWWSNRRYIQQ
ncbi:sulfate ABC transporter permease subunit CysT [Bacillus massiliigorillae]|uniref:sulfate ABC transporter permease subunit CysT n=1 Tax=Bacillus massiliigorillae TaxID=1243664 RepID=UPI0003A94E3B|nr:sulfate ABC transporter permease subunit CysT [Bacillus massiliigorillae]